MDRIDQLLAVKTRLTTIKGYAQLVEREFNRTEPRCERLGAKIAELNSEIDRLADLLERIEAMMAVGERVAPQSDAADDYLSSGC